MFRPRLRGKTGCSTCRSRRKKCDEMRPICDACRRLSLDCIWNGDETQFLCASKIAERQYSDRPMVWPSDINSTGANMNDLRFVCDKDSTKSMAAMNALQRSMNPLALNTYCDMSYIMKISQSETCVRDALNAFGGMFEILDEHSSGVGLLLYTSAVQQLQSILNHPGEHKSTLASSIVCTTLLGIIEGSIFGNSDNAVNHFMAVSTLLVQHRASGGTVQSQSEINAFRVAAECCLYHFAVHAIFNKDILRLPWLIEDRALRECLADFEPDNFTSSPCLAGLYDVYYLIYQVTLLGRWKSLRKSSHAYRTRLQGMKDSICDVEARLGSFFDSLKDRALRWKYQTIIELNIASLKIYFAKISDQSTDTARTLIENILMHSLPLLEAAESQCDHQKTLCTPIFWPLVVHVCAVSNPWDIIAVNTIASTILQNISPGHRVVLEKVQAKAQEQRTHAATMSENSRGSRVTHGHIDKQVRIFDALDLLVQLDGLS